MKATVVTVVVHGFETLGIQRADEDLLDVFQRNWVRIVLGTRLTDHISNGKRNK